MISPSSPPPASSPSPTPTTWDLFGGDAVMQALLDDFYERVHRSTIRHLFPSGAAARAETVAKQFALQSEIWGGPRRYTDQFGPPRIKQRHEAIVIRPSDAAVWLACMRAAVADSAMPDNARDFFLHRMELLAGHMVNHRDE